MSWRHEIELNDALAEADERFDLSRVEEPMPDEVKDLIIAELRKAWPLSRFVKQIQDAKSIAEGNRVLENIFNEADRSRVWCGGFGRKAAAE